MLRVRSESRSLGERQSGLMLEKICLCLTCPAMMARWTPSALEGVDQLGEFAERKPMDGGGAAVLNFREGLFFDRGHNYVEALRTGCVEDQEWELAVACD